MMLNAGTKEGVNKQVKKIQLVRQQELDDLQKILGTIEGRRLLVRLLDLCFDNKTSYTGNAQTYFNEGMRNVSLILKADIEALGIPGIDLLHAAQREAITNQMDIIAKVEQQN